MVAKNKSANEINIEIGKRLKFLRSNEKFTQEEISKELEVNQTTYSRVERGVQPADLRLIVKACVFYKIEPNYLFGYDNKLTKSEENRIKRIVAQANFDIADLMNAYAAELERCADRLEKKFKVSIDVKK